LNGANFESVSVKFFIDNFGEEETDWNSSTQKIINNKAEWEAECMVIHLADPLAEIVVDIREGSSGRSFGICES
jgi:hypothetical protein